MDLSLSNGAQPTEGIGKMLHEPYLRRPPHEVGVVGVARHDMHVQVALALLAADEVRAMWAVVEP